MKIIQLILVVLGIVYSISSNEEAQNAIDSCMICFQEFEKETQNNIPATTLAVYDSFNYLKVRKHLENSINTLKCGHSFHSNCLKGWFETLRKTKICPICKQDQDSESCTNHHIKQSIGTVMKSKRTEYLALINLIASIILTIDYLIVNIDLSINNINETIDGIIIITTLIGFILALLCHIILIIYYILYYFSLIENISEWIKDSHELVNVGLSVSVSISHLRAFINSFPFKYCIYYDFMILSSLMLSIITNDSSKHIKISRGYWTIAKVLFISIILYQFMRFIVPDDTTDIFSPKLIISLILYATGLILLDHSQLVDI